MSSSGADVDGGAGEPADVGQQVLLGVVGLSDRQVRVDGGVDFSAQGVPDPPDPQFRDTGDAVGGQDRGGGLIDRTGSTASISRAPTCRTAERRTPRMATVISSPTTGSAQPPRWRRRRRPGALPGW